MSIIKISVGLGQYIEVDSSVQHLDLSFQRIKALPKQISSLTRLKSLNLSSSNIETLPEDIGNLIHLEVLNCSCTRITHLPESIGQLKNLRELHLSFSRVDALVTGISELENLEILDLTACLIRHLNIDFSKFKKLRKLYLGYLSIKQVPDSIGALHALEELTLNNTKIAVLPQSLAHLQALKKLNLNYTSAIQDYSIVFERLKELQDLNLEGTDIKDLTIYKPLCSKLMNLNLAKNKFKFFPAEFTKLRHLKSLDCSNTALEHIASLAGLDQLKCLNLSNSKLTSLPNNISDCKGLVHLDLSNTALTQLPRNIQSLNNLSILNLYNTPIKGLNTHYLSFCAKKVFAALEKIQRANDEILEQREIENNTLINLLLARIKTELLLDMPACEINVETDLAANAIRLSIVGCLEKETKHDLFNKISLYLKGILPLQVYLN